MIKPSTTTAAAVSISRKLCIDQDIVKSILLEYHHKIKECILDEIPFMMNSFGKFYFRYTKTRGDMHQFKDVLKADYYEKKIYRQLTFKPSSMIKSSANEWVDDLGISNNTNKELLRVSIQPKELSKIRRRQLLSDQQELGFRPDLLFSEDDIPNADKLLIEKLKKAPTVDEIMDKIGANVKED